MINHQQHNTLVDLSANSIVMVSHQTHNCLCLTHRNIPMAHIITVGSVINRDTPLIALHPMYLEFIPWWHHQMETFSALLAFSAGNSRVTDDFPSQRPVRRSFDIFFDLRLNKRLDNSWYFANQIKQDAISMSNTLRAMQNGKHFVDDISKCNSWQEMFCQV